MSRPRLLNALCNPPNNRPIDADRIARDVERALHRSSVLVEHRADLRFDELSLLLDELRPTIFHFIGHGLPDGRLMMKDRDGEVKDFSAAAVAEVLAGGGQPPSLMVLSACHSEALGRELVARGVRCVVATTHRTPDKAIGAFSKAFFEALGRGSSVTEAFDAGKRAVMGEDEGSEGLFVLLPEKPGDAGAVRFVTGLDIPEAPQEGPTLELDLVRQFVIWLDVDKEQPTQAELERVLPARRRGERLWLRLSDHNGPRLDRDREAVLIPWPQLGRAIAALGRELRLQRQADNLPVRYYVVGRAPLAAFVQLGFEVSSWGAPVTLLNQRKTGEWDLIPVDGPAAPEPFFDRLEGIEGRNLAQGRLDVYVSCFGDEPPPSVDRFSAPNLESRAGTVVLSTQAFKAVDARTGPRIAAELVHAFSSLRNYWPEHGRLVIFVRGSATLAFLVGRALNARMESALLTDFAHNTYRPAWAIPWRDTGVPPVDFAEPVGVSERLRILHHLRDAVELFRQRVKAPHLLPPRVYVGPGEEAEACAQKLLNRLKQLQIEREPGREAFEISVARQRLAFGPGLLEGLRGLPGDRIDRLGPLFVLHELLHFDQRLTSRIYRGVGRAGFVLEEIDYWADAFALAALTRVGLSRGGLDAEERCGELLASNIDAHLAAMMAFDRMEQGERIATLMERRLRRYLIWALQRARAETARTAADVERILDERVFVELAPLKGSLSGQWDKVVEGPTEQTQLFVGLGARLLRLPPLPDNFVPAGLIELVSTFQWEKLCDQMATVVELAPAELTPWVL